MFLLSSWTGPQRVPLGEPGNSTVVTVLNAGPGASSYVLHGLYHYRAYTVFLVPFFKTFEGHPSNSRSFETPEAGEEISSRGSVLLRLGSSKSLRNWWLLWVIGAFEVWDEVVVSVSDWGFRSLWGTDG